MFTYFFSLVIIIFEAICCNLFYDVFCKENSRLRKSQKVLLMLSLICCYYLCGLFLSDMLILKMTLVVLAAVIIMSFYFEIIYVFLTIFLYLPKCPQSLILSALRAFCFCGKPRISRSIFLYFPCQSWLKSW